MTIFIKMVWVMVGACLWWTPGGHGGAQRGTMGRGAYDQEARLSLLFVLPARAIDEEVHSGSRSSGAANITAVIDHPSKCRTLLGEVINCTSMSGEAGVLEAVVGEVGDGQTVSDKSADNSTTKQSGDSEIVDNSKTKLVLFTNRGDGKRQFFGQNNNRLGDGGSGGNTLNQAAVRPGSNQGSGGVSNRITGSNPQAAVSMVQSFVEDMINRPNGDRPGYIMINSPNSAIIQQLVAALAQRYGSTSVIQDADAIQNLVGGASSGLRVQSLNTSSSAASSDMPVFPYESRWRGASSTEPNTVPVDPEVDYIRQQLASIARISVSTGQLVNDTLVHLPTTPPTPAITFNLTADATVVSSTPTRTQATEDHRPTHGQANQDTQHPDIQNSVALESISLNSSKEPQSMNQQFGSRDPNLTPEGHLAINEVAGQQDENENDIQQLLDDERREKPTHSKVPDPNSTIGNEDINQNHSGIYINNISQPALTLPESTQQESEPKVVTLVEYRYTNLPLADKNESVNAFDRIRDINPPDIITRPTNNTASTSNLGINGKTNLISVANKMITETPNINSIFDEDSVFGSKEISINTISITPTLDEVSTTGYEDYYEEIDGELVLSPTKFMRKGSPMLTDYVTDEEYYQLDGSGHQTGGTLPFLPQHSFAQSESANPNPFPRNPSLFPITEDILEHNNKDSLTSQYMTSVSKKDSNPIGILNTPLSAANSQAYPTSYFHMNPNTDVGSDNLKSGGNENNHNVTKFILIQNIGDDYIRRGLYPLYPNSGKTLPTSRLSSAGLEGHTNGPVHSSSGGMLPVNDQVLDELWNMDKDSPRLALLEELDRIPVVYEGEDVVTSATILRALPSDMLDHLAHMEERDLATLGLLDQMKTTVGSLHTLGDTAAHPVGEGFPETNSTTQVLLNSRDQTTMSVGVSKELMTSSQTDSVHNVAESEVKVPIRTSFSSSNYRQSDVNIDDQTTQPVPLNFFPRRPTESPPGSGNHGSSHQHHHHNSGHQPQLTPEQQVIISRLPEGMQHVVSSIVLAVQAPSPLTISTTTTTSRPQLYPYPYSYPYPPYPYFLPPSYPYPFPPRPEDLGSSSNDFIVQDARVGGHGVHSGHGTHGDHSAHSGHGTHGSEFTHDNHSPHSTHRNHNVQNSHGTHSNEFVSANHENTPAADARHDHGSHSQGSDGAQDDNFRGAAASNNDVTAAPNRLASALRGTPRPAVLTPSTLGRIPGMAPSLPVVANLPSLVPTYNPAAIGSSRLGEFDASGVDDISETGIRDNDNRQGSINRIGPSQPDRNQGLLQLRRDPAQMGQGRPSGGGFVKYRPQQQTSMHMGVPVVNVVLPEATTSVPVSTEEEIGPLIDPGEDEDDPPVTNAPQTMNREEVNSLLQSLFSSPTLLLLGIVFAASAAYMAIAMEEQAAQQNFQQAQLAAAFGGQPFPPGRRRRRRNLATTQPWYPRRPQLVDH